jgi:hypothetical protein
VLVLAVLALDREVNNGGYHQFFWNSSRRFAPIVAASLRRVGRAEAATLTEKAIAALNPKSLTVEAVEQAILREDSERNSKFDAYDQEFYRLDPADAALLQFIEEHKDQIQLVRTDDYPRRKPTKPQTPSSKLRAQLALYRRGWNPTLEEAREVAKELAQKSGTPITSPDVEAAATLFIFERKVHAADLASAKLLAPHAFELMREDATYIIVCRNWVQLLIDSGELLLADETNLSHLQYVAGFDQSTVRAKNYALYWAPLLQKNREALARSVEFFTANFPLIDLDQPIPVRQIVAGRAAPGTGPPRG